MTPGLDAQFLGIQSYFPVAGIVEACEGQLENMGMREWKRVLNSFIPWNLSWYQPLSKWQSLQVSCHENIYGYSLHLSLAYHCGICVVEVNEYESAHGYSQVLFPVDF